MSHSIDRGILLAAFLLLACAPGLAEAQMAPDAKSYTDSNGLEFKVISNGGSPTATFTMSPSGYFLAPGGLAAPVGIGTTSPGGTLDIENGSNTATLCMNGKCAPSVFPYAISYPSVQLSNSYSASASGCQSGDACTEWQEAGPSPLSITVPGPVNLLVSYTGTYNCNSCDQINGAYSETTYVTYEIDVASGSASPSTLASGFAYIPNTGVTIAPRVIFSAPAAGTYNFSVQHRLIPNPDD